MKNIILYTIGGILLCFFIPILFTEKFVTTNADTNESIVEETVKKESPIIKVLFTKENEVKELALDEYLYGVVSAEMPVNFEMEALKAQAVVARSYTLFKMENNSTKHGEASICNESTCCQAWISKEDRLNKWEESERENNWNKITEAVDITSGEIITYDGKVINAFFHANSGGKTETPVNVWGGGNYPYLQTVETAGEDAYSQYKSEAEFTKEELTEKLKTKYSNVKLELDEIKVLEKFDSGRIKTIKFGNIEIAGVEARTLLGLKSANFDFFIEENKIKFTVYGYGHGVGMSQTGADSLAKEGKSYQDIIKHFYTGVEIENY